MFTFSELLWDITDINLNPPQNVVHIEIAKQVNNSITFCFNTFIKY